jgi:AbrB family looped-hinge helix DNA binding protein
MLITTVRVSEKGQIALPKDIREKAGIERGHDLLIVFENGRILLEPVEFLSGKLEEDFRDMQYHASQALKRVWDNDKDEEWSKELAARYRARGVPVLRPAGKQGASGARRVKRRSK